MLASYARLSFRELCSYLTNTDLVEEGFTKRDLALAALVSFHDFNLEKAIGAMPAQRRLFKLDERTLEIFPGLNDDQFQAIVHYAYLERWPLTSHGLFTALQKNPAGREAALVQAFAITPEFYALQTLFQKSGASISAGSAHRSGLRRKLADARWICPRTVADARSFRRPPQTAFIELSRDAIAGGGRLCCCKPTLHLP